MTEFIINNWQWVSAAVAALVSFFLPGTRTAWNAVFRVLVNALLTKRAIIKVVIYLGDKLVESTKTGIDNAVWVDVRKALIKELNDG